MLHQAVGASCVEFLLRAQPQAATRVAALSILGKMLYKKSDNIIFSSYKKVSIYKNKKSNPILYIRHVPVLTALRIDKHNIHCARQKSIKDTQIKHSDIFAFEG